MVTDDDVSEERHEVIFYMLCELNKLYNSFIAFLLSSAHIAVCGSIIVYRIGVGLLNQKGFALLRRIPFGVKSAAHPEIFIGRGGWELTLKLYIIYV